MFNLFRKLNSRDEYILEQTIQDVLARAIQDEKRLHLENVERRDEDPALTVGVFEQWAFEKDRISAIYKKYPRVAQRLDYQRDCPYCKALGYL